MGGECAADRSICQTPRTPSPFPSTQLRHLLAPVPSACPGALASQMATSRSSWAHSTRGAAP
eukprot:193111-Chlamydomonas_euryale.AAC.1